MMISSYLIAFVSYFVFLITIGLYFYQKNKSEVDFLIGSRSLNYWVTAISAQASDMSAYLFMAVPGAVFVSGFFESWLVICLIVGMWANWQFVAPHLRTETEKYGALTLSSFFERRLNDTSGYIRVISGAISLLFFIFYISSALVALGRMLELTFGMDYHTGIIISVGIAMLYTLIGGFVAVAWSDLFQGLFLLGVIIMVPAIAYTHTGGLQAITQTAHAHNISLSLFPDFSLATIASITNIVLGWGLGYFGQPHILINFMGIDDVKKMKKAQIVGISWQIIALTAAVVVGLVGIPFFNASLANPELVFVTMARTLFSPLVTGFILCAILAATISTVNTQMLVSASILSEDFYKKLFNKQATPIQLLRISRLCIIVVPIIASILAFNNSKSILDLVNYAWSGLGSAFGPLVLCLLYGSWPTQEGVLAGMISGAIVAALWPYMNTTVLPLIPGFLTSLVTLYVVSQITKKSSLQPTGESRDEDIEKSPG